MFERIHKVKLTVSFEKCYFCRPELKYLGYVVDKNGLYVSPEKVQAMIHLLLLKIVKEVRRRVREIFWKQ